MNKFTCAICGAPMKLKQKLSTIKKPTVMYTRKRFICTICDFEEVIYANGKADRNVTGAIEDIENNFKQEQENRES